MNLEKRALRVGYIPLTDSLPLVAAVEQGFFADEGLDVTLSCEASWATVRDKLIIGQLDAAQVLAPMVLAASLGLGGLRKPMTSAFCLGLNGNAITVSNDLFGAISAAAGGGGAVAAGHALAAVMARRRQRGGESLVFATVFPFSNHNYLLRYWLAACGIDPDRDLRIVALPPQQMVDNLRLGHIDGYCVGEPWNSAAVVQGLGHCLVTGYEIWQNAPEKMLGVTAAWAEQYPAEHAALLRALQRAGQWIEQDLSGALRLLSRAHDMAVPLEWLMLPFTDDLPVGVEMTPRGPHHFHVFHRFAANYPWRSHAAWMASQMQRWGQLPQGRDDALTATIEQAWRSDLHRQLLGAAAAVPLADEKVDGAHAEPWQVPGTTAPVWLAPDRFLDGVIFSS